MLKVYGISNCDTVKRARTWLTEQNVAFEFHDFKKLGVQELDLHDWCNAMGWQQVLNRSGTTWRKADVAQQAAVVDQATAVHFMVINSSAIKRPVVRWGVGRWTVGFRPDAFALARLA